MINICHSLEEPNYDESKVPHYRLPDLFTTLAGDRVDTPEKWYDCRRKEILELFKTFMFGKTPATFPEPYFEIQSINPSALDGTATRKNILVYLLGKNKPQKIDLVIYLPNHAIRPTPIFLGMNFFGNHTIWPDPEIPLTESWVRNNEEFGISENRATEQSRGVRKERWPLDLIIAAGYGLADVYYGDIEPDEPSLFDQSIRKFLLRPGQTRPDPDEWGAIGAWAWGFSRAMDYLEKDPDIDPTRVIAIGHSRLGKTALWAGAQDERFAVAISNNSGCGGAALSRRKFGETIELINERFPHWFCGNFKKYNRNESECPVDQHMLLALMAPRAVYVASAEQDKWADPKGEFLAAVHASPVYELLGYKGLPTKKMPPVNTPTHGGMIGYHIRTGEHNLTSYDWQCYIDFCNCTLPQIEEVSKIWEGAEHNAFTDLIRFNEKWFCTFREADTHAGGCNGVIRILTSIDGKTWESAAVLQESGVDLRDPKLSITPDNRLMLLMGGSIYINGEFKTLQSRVTFSHDGTTWEPIQKILNEHDWLWRITWHKKTAYGVVYNSAPSSPYAPWTARLVRSTDGIHYDLVTVLQVPSYANEATIRFTKGNKMLMLIRRDHDNKEGWIGTSSPPYQNWSWRSTKWTLGGPNFIEGPNGKFWAASRIFLKTLNNSIITRTCIAQLDEYSYRPALVLPSGGDTSYPGLVYHEGKLWVSYYSSHEAKTAIYLAKIRIPEK